MAPMPRFHGVYADNSKKRGMGCGGGGAWACACAGGAWRRRGVGVCGVGLQEAGRGGGGAPRGGVGRAGWAWMLGVGGTVVVSIPLAFPSLACRCCPFTRLGGQAVRLAGEIVRLGREAAAWDVQCW